jgi:hypothetical protein
MTILMQMCMSIIFNLLLILSSVGLCIANPLHIDEHYLVDDSGRPVFLMADTAWLLLKADRDQIKQYLDHRKCQGFNSVSLTTEFTTDHYGNEPFKFRPGTNEYDVSKPIVRLGSDPNDPTQYDYWDHIAYIIRQAAARDMYVIISTGASPSITGTYAGNPKGIAIEEPEQAYALGHFEGRRFRSFDNIIFMTLDDRSPINNGIDKTMYYQALAEGIADGTNNVNKFDGSVNYSSRLIFAMPRKKDPSSSYWFHNDRSFNVNSIQAYPWDGYVKVLEDFAKTPIKPTFIAESCYEGATTNGIKWDDWSIRYQAYLGVFAGAFGAVYGNNDIWPIGSDWMSHLNDPGAMQMQHLVKLMNYMDKQDYLSRVPDQSLILGRQGIVDSDAIGGDRIQATRADRMAFFYSMNGRTFSVKMSKLPGPKMMAWWYSPRTGKFKKKGKEYAAMNAVSSFASAYTGTGAANKVFDPPGFPSHGNDWVLMLKLISKKGYPLRSR